MRIIAPHASETRVLEHPFFEGMDPHLLRTLVPKAVEREYDVGDYVAQEGSPCDEFLLVFEGKLALEIGAADRPHLTVQTVGSGEVVGWSWFVAPNLWRFDVRAVKPTRVVALNAPTVRHALASHASLGYDFLARLLPVLAERLENTRVQLLDTYGR